MKRAGLLALVSALVLAGCTKEGSYQPAQGSQIMFGASTEWLNGFGTRTEYSGKDERGNNIGSSSSSERIDWEPGYDRIRILCAAAENGPTSDYDLTGSTTVVAQKSQAKVTPTKGNGLRWGAETDDHYFYALYPAAGMKSKQGKTVADTDATIAAVSGNGATVTGKIPATQSVVKEGNVYKPDMNYAYMYAATKHEAGSTGTVSLSFNPLVTAFEFTLLTPPGDPITAKLTMVKLKSASTDLTGDFTASLTPSGLTPLTSSDITSAGREISVSLPDGGVLLSDDTPVKVTLLALPVSQTELTLELVFANGGKRTLELKKNSNTEWVEVAACKKIYIQNVGVPGSLYYFDVEGPSTSLNGEASSSTYKVKSYKNASGEDVGVGWTAKFLEEGKTEWSDTPPSWVTAFTSSDASGSVTAKSYTASVSKNDATTERHWGGATTPGGNTTKETAINLARVDIYGNTLGTDLTTANCYVVSKPGWYKFPCVYGNAFKNGEHNTAAYTSSNTRDHMLQRFVRHDDQPITDPWIQNNFTDLRYDEHAHARLLWQDRQGLVATSGSNAVFSQRENTYSALGRYIYFYVDPAYIDEGNAVIALYLDDTIVWSWHIWVTEQSNLATTKVYHEPTCPSVVNPEEMMVTNLGWYDADLITTPRSVQVKITQSVTGRTAEFTLIQDQLHAKGGNTYFQWGRKDPMLGMDETFVEKTQYPEAADWVITTTGGRVSIGTAMQHPNIFYATTCWNATRYDNLWNGNNATAYDVDVAVVKTVYDPCPVGFKVPNRNVFSGFRRSNPVIGTWNQGWLFKRNEGDTEGIFFPATFLRERHTGEIDTWRREGGYEGDEWREGYVGGYYWSAASLINALQESNWGGAYLEFRNTWDFVGMASSKGPTGYGFSIRPVKE